MGFTRKKGNWHTDETHGSKSKIFTYEEKYTWLAVHYLQGYLSDNIPMKQWSEGREFVKDYSQLTNIPNPAESFLDKSTDRPKRKKEWIVKQTLSRELEAGSDLKFRIKNWVNEDPNLNFKSWLKFSSADLNLTKEKREWIALLNKTSLHDSKKIVYTLVDARACIIKKDDLHGLKKIIEENPDALHFISDLEYLRSSPQTETYCNPSDIVWMTWIDEDEKTQRFYDEATEEEKEIDHAITRIIQNTMDGESILMLPSKKVRELIQVYELNESELRNQDGTVMAFNHKISDGSFDDDQELVLVDYQKLKQALDKENSELIWFIDLYKKKNPLNKSLGDKFYIQKSRKYFVWIEDGEFKSIKFWDEAATNIRDKDFG